MYLEKRKFGKRIKYYLVHSYRDEEKVQKIRKYLGSDLSEAELENRKQEAKEHILSLLEEISTKVFNFKLTNSQIRQLNRYNDKIKVAHLDEREWQKFTEEFVYNTNAIEGSTVQRDEVPEILHKANASDAEEIETKGVAQAVKFIRTTKQGLSIPLIKKIHALCFKGSKEFAGKIRKVEVVIRNADGEIFHQGVPASKLNLALKDMILWDRANHEKFKPLVLAAIIHNQFEHIHPFQDGNGRVGRLLLNYILLQNGYPPINIELKDRFGYYSALRDYDSVQDLRPMLKLLIWQYKKTLRKVTTKIKKK